ncbi:MAG: molybdate ABC transporter substrate-binding protein [Myxococcaceae bacterium]
MTRPLVLAAALLAGLPASAGELLVFAASSTAPPLEELARDFSARGGERVRFAFGASNDLARQIAAGAPAEVFLSADVPSMERLERAGLVRPAERFALLSNVLSVVVPVASQAKVSGARDLLAFKRIAMADPQGVPLGVYARAWLERAGVWAQLSSKIVPTLDARSALAAVAAGNADAGVVYRSDARLSTKVRVAFEVPRAEGPSIVYPIAVLSSSKAPRARAFVEYLRGQEARAVFARHGFSSAE